MHHFPSGKLLAHLECASEYGACELAGHPSGVWWLAAAGGTVKLYGLKAVTTAKVAPEATKVYSYQDICDRDAKWTPLCMMTHARRSLSETLSDEDDGSDVSDDQAQDG